LQLLFHPNSNNQQPHREPKGENKQSEIVGYFCLLYQIYRNFFPFSKFPVLSAGFILDRNGQLPHNKEKAVSF
jgi:hypothetical protein